jgi:DNA primase
MRGTDMLLQEGMNIKVLLLPDGDDPDSFARKHTAQEFKQYVEDHQKDFIQFKSDLMLRGVTDPIKRSEAINSIVRSISVIPDQIVRATYLTDCSHRLGINEATLISTMNKMIRESGSRKESRGNDATGARGPENNVSAGGNAAPANDSQLASSSPRTLATSPSSPIEDMLIRAVIRHGGEVIYDNVETEDGSVVSLTVAQYISYNLGSDGLSFSTPLYNKVLDEAAAHPANSGFDSVSYFTRHHDVEISNLATSMVVDRVQLSKSLQMKEEKGSLCNHVEHLILDFRLNYVDNHMKDLQRQIILAANDSERMLKLMQEYKDLQDIRNQMAKRLGSNIIV